MVPEPSMRLFPTPFIGPDTGAEVVYMTRPREEEAARGEEAGVEAETTRGRRRWWMLG